NRISAVFVVRIAGDADSRDGGGKRDRERKARNGLPQKTRSRFRLRDPLRSFRLQSGIRHPLATQRRHGRTAIRSRRVALRPRRRRRPCLRLRSAKPARRQRSGGDHVRSDAAAEMEPALRPQFTIDEVNNKVILAVEVDEVASANKPCFYKPAGLPKGAYVRVGNINQQLLGY